MEEAFIPLTDSNIFIKLRGHWLARDSSWILFGQGTSIALQVANFIFLARLLHVTEYGIFAGAFAITSIVAPYSTLGSNMLFMRYVSIDRSLSRIYWGNGLLVTSALSALAAIVLGIFGPSIANQESHLIFVVLVAANCFLWQVVVLASAVFQTLGKMRVTATLTFLTNLTRFVMVLGMLRLWHHADALQWSFAVLIASGAAAIAAVVWVAKEIGLPKVETKLAVKRLWEGFGFGFAGATQSIYNDVDKAVLSHYGLNRENGFYTLAYRTITIASAPITAIDSSVLPRYFQMGRPKMAAVMRLAWKSAGIAAMAGLAMSLFVYLSSPLIPRLVGRDFSGVLTALKWLCWIPALRGVHQLTGSALTGTGFQNRRTVAQFAVALLNVILNFLWIRTSGWIGAAWSSVVSDGALAVLNVLLLVWTWRQVLRRQTKLSQPKRLDLA